MFTISKDSQALYITAVAKDRLPIFQTDAIKTVTCQAIDEARTSCGFLLFAYVIMPDHMHLLTDSPRRKPSEVLRYIKGTVCPSRDWGSEREELRKLARKTAARRLEAKSSPLALAARDKRLSSLQRKRLYAEGELHQLESSASRIS